VTEPPRAETFGFRDPQDYSLARDVFARANYDQRGLHAALGSSRISIQRKDLPSSLHRTSGGSPLETLIRLFFLEVPVEVTRAREALLPMSLETWADAGLIEEREGRVGPGVRIAPVLGRLFASDVLDESHAARRADFVAPVGGSSQLLAKVALRRAARHTLDLGTGCGVIALVAAATSDRVCATDKNARAVAFTRFNARLNGVSNVECLEGSLFEPVAGRRFDLILSNPPYVISPTSRFVYRDSGLRGDEFCRRLVRDAAELLDEGGFLQMICNWPHVAGRTWRDCVAEWFGGTGCDAMVWGGDTQDAAAYAKTWINDTETSDVETVHRLYEQWMRYFADERIEAVSYGVVMMRRSSQRPNWIAIDDRPEAFADPCGDACLASFEREDLLRSLSDERQLLEERFRLSPDLRLEQRARPTDDGWSIEEVRLKLSSGLLYDAQLDANVSELLMRYRGERRLRDVFAEIATEKNADFEQLVPGGLEIVRRLVRRGYLLPVPR
jgi:methylase of polypeptide subunit release factors